MMRIACVVIATERRRAQTWTKVVPSVCDQDFDDVVVVGDWWAGSPLSAVKYLCVEPLTRTTADALVKRDAGTLATDGADVLVYLNDDHALEFGFAAALRDVLDEPWDVIVPNRYTTRGAERVALNNGERDAYCAGHAGVFRRDVVVAQPWSAHTHHRNWDVLISKKHIAAGVHYVWNPRAELSIIDIEPHNQPWL